ncbi:MAG: NAD(P)-binding domain-containing protein [Pseudomonadota bacterium]
MTTTIGIIGAGHLIRHMMPAMSKTGSRFLVSERGRETSAHLAEHYGVEVLADNQSIIDQSEIVIVAVRPFDAVEVCEALSFADGQTVLSLCAGLPSSDLAPAIAPARLVMAMPVVAAQFSESPTLMFPEHQACRKLLESCGPVLALKSEDSFAPAATIACYYGWVQELISQMSDWVSAQGVDPEIARLLTAQMTRAAATTVRERPSTPTSQLVSELATPRSFTLKGLEVLHEADAFTPWKRAADALLRAN